ncbi:MAG: xanthine dehydrogenase accessory protein XdhC [Octadecabacter sp.]
MSDFILITITSTAGSAPRDAGATMTVWEDGQTGTIGGGALEWEATHTARRMLKSGQNTLSRTMPLGPGLGQCCGGSVTLDWALNAAEVTPAAAPLWVWGAGHVGRAIVAVMAPLPDYEITWVDTTQARFPEVIPEGVTSVPANEMPRLAQHAPDTANHLILTYSHEIDLALCDALLRRGFASTGLIGSATKWARFRGRLSKLGHTHEQISRIACPIGQPELGKHPYAIAVGVAAALLGQADVAIRQGETAG